MFARQEVLVKLYKNRVLSLCKLACISKSKKLSKKLLTNKNKSAIMCKLTTSGLARNIAKIFEELFKNLLTSVLGCGIIVGLSKNGKFENSEAEPRADH